MCGAAKAMPTRLCVPALAGMHGHIVVSHLNCLFLFSLFNFVELVNPSTVHPRHWAPQWRA